MNKCRWPGCSRLVVPGKVYCAHHIQSGPALATAKINGQAIQDNEVKPSENGYNNTETE